MRFVLSLPFMMHPMNPDFLTQEAIAEVACAAEDAGFDAVAVTEQPMPTDTWLDGGGINIPKHLAHLALLAEIGVTWTLAPIFGPTLNDLKRVIVAYRRDVIQR